MDFQSDNDVCRYMLENPSFDPSTKSCLAKLEKGMKKLNGWIKEVAPKKSASNRNRSSSAGLDTATTSKASAYSAPEDDAAQARCNYLETAKKLVECVKKMSPLLASLKRDDIRIGESIEEFAKLLRQLKIRGSDIAREQEESAESDTTCPSWLVEPCRNVVLFDIGLRMQRMDFRYALEPIDK